MDMSFTMSLRLASSFKNLIHLHWPSITPSALFPSHQLNSDKLTHQLEAQLSETNGKLDEHSRSISELNSVRSRMTNENVELTRQLEESESNAGQMSKNRMQLLAQLEELKRNYEEESRVSIRTSLCFVNEY